jgi:hypothetical protein
MAETLKGRYRIPDHLAGRIAALASDLGLSQAAVARLALKRGLEKIALEPILIREDPVSYGASQRAANTSTADFKAASLCHGEGKAAAASGMSVRKSKASKKRAQKSGNLNNRRKRA